jgi:hypothetical protein
MLRVPQDLQSRCASDWAYARGFLTSSPVLRQEIEAVTQSEIRLKNGLSIICRANSYRTTRGRTLVCAIFDEASF